MVNRKAAEGNGGSKKISSGAGRRVPTEERENWRLLLIDALASWQDGDCSRLSDLFPHASAFPQPYGKLLRWLAPEFAETIPSPLDLATRFDSSREGKDVWKLCEELIDSTAFRSLSGGLGEDWRQELLDGIRLAQQKNELEAIANEVDAGVVKSTAHLASILETTVENWHDSSKRENPFRPRSVLELRNRPPVQFLVDSLVVANELNVIYGTAGHGKTFVALSLALAVATGQRWLGSYNVLSGPVVYMLSEGINGLHQRVFAWQLSNNISDEEVAKNFFYVDLPVRLFSAEEVALFRQGLRELPEPPKLVVIDTLGHSFAGAGKNPDCTADMQEFINVCLGIRREFECAVILVHHTRKADDVEAGNHALRAGASSMLLLKHNGLSPEGNGQIKLTSTKLRDGNPLSGSIFLQQNKIEVGKDDEGRALTSAVIVQIPPSELSSEMPPEKREVLTALSELFRAKVPPDDWVSLPELKAATGKSKSGLTAYLNDLEQKNYITTKRQGREKFCKPTYAGMEVLSHDSSA